jgi:hypothetical protein
MNNIEKYITSCVIGEDGVITKYSTLKSAILSSFTGFGEFNGEVYSNGELIERKAIKTIEKDFLERY